jgi:hypothetical protein
MASEVIKVSTFQEKINSAFINLTEINSTTYPATTSIQIDQPEFSTTTPALTTYYIYDQWAMRTKAV